MFREEWRLAGAGPWDGSPHEVMELGGWADRVPPGWFEVRRDHSVQRWQRRVMRLRRAWGSSLHGENHPNSQIYHHRKRRSRPGKKVWMGERILTYVILETSRLH